MKQVIAIVDYGMGNVQSIKNALNKFNFNVVLTKDKDQILQADGVILPGVGAFKNAMNQLEKDNLPDVLCEYVSTKKPLLGICLGMQLLFNGSEEFGMTKGLGLINGIVEKFPSTTKGKLPHISWNEITPKLIDWNNTMFDGVTDKDNFYFVHSYICKPNDNSMILSTTEYGEIEFCSAIQKNNIYGCQFHPEKSAGSGMNVINNYLKIVSSI